MLFFFFVLFHVGEWVSARARTCVCVCVCVRVARVCVRVCSLNDFFLWFFSRALCVPYDLLFFSFFFFVALTRAVHAYVLSFCCFFGALARAIIYMCYVLFYTMCVSVCMCLCLYLFVSACVCTCVSACDCSCDCVCEYLYIFVSL